MIEQPKYRVMFLDGRWSNWRPITMVDINETVRAIHVSETATKEQYDDLCEKLPMLR